MRSRGGGESEPIAWAAAAAAQVRNLSNLTHCPQLFLTAAGERLDKTSWALVRILSIKSQLLSEQSSVRFHMERVDLFVPITCPTSDSILDVQSSCSSECGS